MIDISILNCSVLMHKMTMYDRINIFFDLQQSGNHKQVCANTDPMLVTLSPLKDKCHKNKYRYFKIQQLQLQFRVCNPVVNCHPRQTPLLCKQLSVIFNASSI